MDQLCDFSDFLWLFMAFLLLGFLWQWRRPFLGTSLNIIYIDNVQGILEHVSDFLYLQRFRRYLIKTLSRMFENRIVKLVWRPYMKVSNHLAILVNFMSILKMTSWWQVLFSSPKLSNGILNASFTWRAESEQWHPEGKFYTATDKCQSLSHLILHW